MTDSLDSPEALEALANLRELDSPNLRFNPDSPRKTAEMLAVIFEHLDSFGLLTSSLQTRIATELSEFLELPRVETERVIEQLEVLAPHMPDRFAISATARRWSAGNAEQTESDTVAGVLYPTNRWNVIVPGASVRFPVGCICCGDTHAEAVHIVSSRTAPADADDLRHEKTASVINTYEVCEFCSRHFDQFRNRQLLYKGVPIAAGISFILGLIPAGLWLFESPQTIARSVFGWISLALLTTALILYVAGRKMNLRWSTEVSGLKSACRSSTCPITVELDTSPTTWKMKASYQEVAEATEGVEEKVSARDMDPSTRLFVLVSGFTDMEAFARQISAVNGRAEVVQAVLED